MKRAAVSLFVWCAISGWAAAGHAKRGGAKAAPPPPAAEPAAAAEKAAPAAAEKAGGDAPAAADEKEAAVNEALEPDEGKTGKVEEGEGQAKQGQLTTAPWQDIVVAPRKPFLKGGRLEMAPFTGLSINDNLIRHYAFGADINF